MTTPGWVMMITSISFVVLLAGFCFRRVLATPRGEKHQDAG